MITVNKEIKGNKALSNLKQKKILIAKYLKKTFDKSYIFKRKKLQLFEKKRLRVVVMLKMVVMKEKQQSLSP